MLAGGSDTQGISLRSPFQNLVNAPEIGGQPGDAGFQQHHGQRREPGEHALGDQAGELRLEAGRLVDVVLGEVARPADRRDRMAIGAAGVDADRQPVALGGGIDRPVLAASERQLAADQQQHLHEAAVGGDPFDLGRGQIGIQHRHDDGGAQPVVAVQPFARDPVVDGAAEDRGDVVAERHLRAVEAVQDAEPGAERGKCLGGQPVGRGGALALRVTPVGARAERIDAWVGDRDQLVETAPNDRFAPVVVQERQQGLQPRNGGVQVTVDRAGLGHRRAVDSLGAGVLSG